MGLKNDVKILRNWGWAHGGNGENWQEILKPLNLSGDKIITVQWANPQSLGKCTRIALTMIFGLDNTLTIFNI